MNTFNVSFTDLAKSIDPINGRLTELKGTSENCFLIQINIGAIEVRGEGVNYFFALMESRRALESLGYLILVQGARRSVWPRGLEGDWSLGRSAEDHSVDHSLSVNIYDPCEITEAVTVEEQESYPRMPALSPKTLERIRKAEEDLERQETTKEGQHGDSSASATEAA